MTNKYRATGIAYIKSLDGLRAIAALTVVFFHSPVQRFAFQFGWAGVNLFFILSGFLITRILLGIKHVSFKNYAVSFYARRCLRIFPLYFLYLLIAVLILYLLNYSITPAEPPVQQGLADFRNNYPYLLTYTYNFEEVINFLRHRDYSNSMAFGHLWSLSVEGQFYLVFPVIVYFVPVKWLKRILVVIIFLTPFLRLLFVELFDQKNMDLFWVGDVLYVFTPFQLDTLSIGACIALFDFGAVVKNIKIYLVAATVLLIITGIVHLYLLKAHHVNIAYSSLGFDNPVYHVINPLRDYWLNNRYFYSIPLLNVFFGLLVLAGANGKLLPAIFENRFLVRIGKISYGIYIYHLFFSYLFGFIFHTAFGKEPGQLNVFGQVTSLIVYLTLLCGIALLSYYGFERKFLLLKER